MINRLSGSNYDKQVIGIHQPRSFYLGITLCLILACITTYVNALSNFPHARELIPLRASLTTRIGNEDVGILDESPQSFIRRTASSMVDTDAPFGETLHLNIESSDGELSINRGLTIDRSMFGPDSQVFVDNDPHPYFAPYTSYRTEYTDDNGDKISIIATVVEEVEGKFHSITGMITKNKETYELMSADRYAVDIESELRTQQENIKLRRYTSRQEQEDAQKMINELTDHLEEVDKARRLSPQNILAFRMSNFEVTDENGSPMLQCGVAVTEAETEPEDRNRPRGRSPLSRRPQALKRWSCPAFPQGDDPKIRMNLLVDYGAAKFLSGGSGEPRIDRVMSQISGLGAMTNQVFRKQLGLTVLFDRVHIATKKMVYPWAYDQRHVPDNKCPFGGVAEDILEQARRWHASRPEGEKVGLTHQLTACLSIPGVVGIAYPGTLCDKNLGVGVTHVYNNYWITFAHEVGHNLGASHPFTSGDGLKGSFGGIMDYNTQGRLLDSDPDSPGVVGFNRLTDQNAIYKHVAHAYTAQTWNKVPLDVCWVKKPETMAT